MAGLHVDEIRNAAGTGAVPLYKQWAAKAWLNMTGTGTIAINNSKNIASITDNGAGHYYANFTSLMAASTFAQTSAAGPSLIGIPYLWDSRTTARAELAFGYPNNTAGGISLADNRDCHLHVHGDLA